MEHPGLVPVPISDASVTSGGFTHYVITLALYHFFCNGLEEPQILVSLWESWNHPLTDIRMDKCPSLNPDDVGKYLLVFADEETGTEQ